MRDTLLVGEIMRLSKVVEYWKAAAAIAKGAEKSTISVMIKLVACRMIMDVEAEHYILFNFNSKPFLAPKDYITRNEIVSLCRPVNSKAGCKLIGNKLGYYMHSKRHALPVADVLGILRPIGSMPSPRGAGHQSNAFRLSRVLGEPSFDVNGIPLMFNERDIYDVVKQHGAGTYLLKPAMGSLGLGIVRFHLKGEKLLTDESSPLSESVDFNNFSNDSSCAVLQKSLRPHADLRSIMPGTTLGTVRLITIAERDDVSVAFGCVKIPVGNNIADNFASGFAGNLLAGVDLETGQLLRVFGPDPAGLGLVEEVFRHPDTGTELPGYYFPSWTSILEAVKVGSKAFGELKTIGWDVALTEDGPCLIEANSCYDVGILQVAVDRGLKQNFQELLGSIA